MRSFMNRSGVIVAGLLALAGCKEKKNANGEPTSVIKRVEAERVAKRLPSLGQRVLEGDAQDLRAAPDGTFVTVLVDAIKPTIAGVPPPMKQGALWQVSTNGGKSRKLGNGVINMPGGSLITADSRWVLFSAAYDPQQATGELYVQDAKDPDAERVRLSVRASYFVPSDDGAQVAFVERGVLRAGRLPDGPFPELAGDVSNAEFSSDGRYLYFRRKFAAAGGLYQLDLSAAKPEPRRLIDQVTDYTVLRTGRHVVTSARAAPSSPTLQLHVFDVATLKSVKLSDDATRYRISRDGKFIAWRDSASGTADRGVLTLAALDGSGARELGRTVNNFDFSDDGRRFVYRDNYQELARMGRDPGDLERVGDLYVLELPDGAPKLLARQSPNFTFAPGGSALAFTARIERPEFTRRLLLYPVGATEPIALRDWLYEYQFAPTGETLFFRSDCTREHRSCELNSISATMAPEDKPKKEAEATYGFRLSADGKRALVASAHLTDLTYDIALQPFDGGERKLIDQYVEWPALLLSTGGVAYLVKEKQRAGVYVANGL